MEPDLIAVREWAKNKIAAGDEPPWSWYQHMKLIEALDAILAGQASVSPTGNLQRSDTHLGTHLRLVGSNDQQDSVQRHQADVPVQMPM